MKSSARFPQKTITIVTHNGGFHADDVFGVATLTLLFRSEGRDFKIVRTRDPKIIESADVVLDVGGIYDEAKNRFDHHQIGGAGGRQNHIPYASFGLIWKKFGEDISGGKNIADKVDQNLVAFIDAGDNGVGEFKPVAGDLFPYTLLEVVRNFNPGWKDDYARYDVRFDEAVVFAISVLQNEIKYAGDLLEGKAHVRTAYENSEDKRLMILDKKYPWEELVADCPDILFVVEPASESGESASWKVYAVKKSQGFFENRKDLPLAWAGKRDSDFVSVSGVSDAIFCHTKRFVAYAKSKEGAISLARLALTAKN